MSQVSYPEPVQAFHNALLRLPGVLNVSSGIDSLQGVRVEHLSSAEFAYLPLGALNRTNGGLGGEVMVQFQFYLEQTLAGWRALEFLAWFVRDAAQSGEQIQLRPFALLPIAGEQIQLGHTLRFHIDLFCPSIGRDITPVLAKIEHLADFLNQGIDLYKEAIFTRS